MDIDTLLNSKIFIALASAFGGIVVSVITQNWMNRRSLFTYYVSHNQIGLTTDDEVYGSVKVTWNDNLVARLYLSTVELINESTKDFEFISVRIFTNNSLLLTQRAELSETTRNLDFTEEYKEEIYVPDGEQPTNHQLDLYRSRRDYLIPTMNRGQKVRFELLNAAKTEEEPTIWLEILQKGINCKIRVAHELFMGVPQPMAALVGSVVGFVAIIFILLFTSNLWVAGILSYVIGLTVLVPGAFVIKIYRKIRVWFAG